MLENCFFFMAAINRIFIVFGAHVPCVPCVPSAILLIKTTIIIIIIIKKKKKKKKKKQFDQALSRPDLHFEHPPRPRRSAVYGRDNGCQRGAFSAFLRVFYGFFVFFRPFFVIFIPIFGRLSRVSSVWVGFCLCT
jgi:hypothetical protein